VEAITQRDVDSQHALTDA
jgi:hypothetical protein